MTFDEWIAAYEKANSGKAVNLKRDMGACWNAALEAAAKACEAEPMFNEDDPGETFAAAVRRLATP